MRQKFSDRPGRVYLSLVATMMMTVALTMLVLSAFLYTHFENIAAGQIYAEQTGRLAQTSRSVAQMTASASSLSRQIFNDTNVASLLYSEEPGFAELRTALNQLTGYSLMMEDIASVYVYNARANMVVVSSADQMVMPGGVSQIAGFVDAPALEMLSRWQTLRPGYPVPRQIRAKDGVTRKKVYSFVQYDALAGKEPESAVVVNFSESWMQRLMTVRQDTGDFWVLDADNEVVAGTRADGAAEGLAGAIATRDGPGYSIQVIGGRKSLVCYTGRDSLGWRYISVVPWETLFRKVDDLRTLTVTVSLLILAGGLAAVLVLSRRLFGPVRNAFSRMSRMEAEQHQQRRQAALSLIRDALTGADNTHPEILAENLARFGMPQTADGMFRLTAMHIDGYRTMAQETPVEELNLLRFGILNIAEELGNVLLPCTGVDMGQGQMVLLWQIPPELGGIVSREFVRVLEDIQTTVRQHLGASLSMTVTTDESGPESWPFLYRQSGNAMVARLFAGPSALLLPDQYQNTAAEVYHYPFAREKAMLEALHEQKPGEARALCAEILSSVRGHSLPDYHLMLARMVFAVNDAVSVLRRNHPALQHCSGLVSVLEAGNADTVDSLLDMFSEVFFQVCVLLGQRKNARYDMLIQRIHAMIETQFMDAGLSVEAIADALKISMPYMCRIYKQQTGNTMLDQIISVRMMQARRLLETQNGSVADIAARTGFSNSSYFYKTFKRVHGMTPSDFRKARQSGEIL